MTRREPVKKDQVDWNDFFDMAEHFMEKKLEVDLSDQPITMSAKYDRKSSVSHLSCFQNVTFYEESIRFSRLLEIIFEMKKQGLKCFSK